MPVVYLPLVCAGWCVGWCVCVGGGRLGARTVAVAGRRMSLVIEAGLTALVMVRGSRRPWLAVGAPPPSPSPTYSTTVTKGSHSSTIARNVSHLAHSPLVPGVVRGLGWVGRGALAGTRTVAAAELTATMWY